MNKKIYPLTQTQNTIMYSLKYVPQQYANIAFEFVFSNDIDKDTMLQAMTLSMMRNPSNYTRLIKTGKEIKQYFTNDSLDKVDYLVFSDDETYDKSLNEYAQKPFANKSLETQLYRIRLVKKPNGEFAIHGCFSHIIYDAYSIMVAFKDICEIYKALLYEKPIPKITYSLLEAFEMDYAYNNSTRYKTDEEFFDKNVFSTEPQFTCINGKDDKHFISNQRKGKMAISLSMKGGMLDLPIDKGLVDKVNAYSLNNKISTQALYILACRSYLAKVCEVDDVSISSVVDRRPTLIHKKSGGTMADATYVRTIFSGDVSFREALNIVNSAELLSYKHSSYSGIRSIEMTHKKFKCSQIETYSTFYFTYNPYIYVDDIIKYKVRHISSGKETLNVYLSIMPCDSDMNYVGNYSYQSKFVSKEKIKEFHDFMIKFIQVGVGNDELSINKIVERAK